MKLKLLLVPIQELKNLLYMYLIFVDKILYLMFVYRG